MLSLKSGITGLSCPVTQKLPQNGPLRNKLAFHATVILLADFSIRHYSEPCTGTPRLNVSLQWADLPASNYARDDRPVPSSGNCKKHLDYLPQRGQMMGDTLGEKESTDAGWSD